MVHVSKKDEKTNILFVMPEEFCKLIEHLMLNGDGKHGQCIEIPIYRMSEYPRSWVLYEDVVSK